MSYVSRRNWKRKSSGFGYSDKGGIHLRTVIIFLFLLFLVFEIISSMFITSYRVDSISMEPTIPSGSVVLTSPLMYGAEIPFTSIKAPGFRKPGRGDIVVAAPSFHQVMPWYLHAADSIIRFFTLQKRGIDQERNWVTSKSIKRIVGVPGDTLKMTDFEIQIKPEGKNYFFSEKEIMQVEYNIERYSTPDELPGNFPLSGNMKEVRLGPDEYFLMGDNRSRSNDSYYWGPVGGDNISAKVILEYAPEIKMLQ